MQKMDSLNPWRQLIECSTGEIRRLDHVWRYSSIPIVTKENVAQHSYYVAIYSILIHQLLEKHTLYADGFDKNHLKLSIIIHALTHDLIEMKTGDIVRVMKYITPELKREIDRAEELLTETVDPMIKSLFILSANSLSCYDEENKTYIESVVKAADFLSLFQYMRHEILVGNMEVIPFYKRMISDIVSMNYKHETQKTSFAKFYHELLLNAKDILFLIPNEMQNVFKYSI